MVKKTSIGLGIVMLLSTLIALAGSDNGTHKSREAQTSLSDEEARREAHRAATREAIRRAVKGGDAEQQEFVEKRYQPVDHEEIGKYIGSWVKLETYYGRKVEGTLRKVTGDMLYIDEHVGQGSASYPIDKTKLSGLQVLR